MNLTQLDVLFSDNKLKQDLLKLIARKIEIEQSIASYDDDLNDIKKEAEGLGLKITEFNRIVKDFVNQEATLNQMEYLDKLNDHILGGLE